MRVNVRRIVEPIDKLHLQDFPDASPQGRSRKFAFVDEGRDRLARGRGGALGDGERHIQRPVFTHSNGRFAKRLAREAIERRRRLGSKRCLATGVAS